MRLLILADIDDFHWVHETRQADVLLACGGIHEQLILEAAQTFNCCKVFAVKGDDDFDRPFPPPIIDLHLRIERHGGLTFGGLNGSWRYQPRGFLREQDGPKLMLTGFPAVDVFVSHYSPRGTHDTEDETHFGFEALDGYISKAKPRLLVHGHQHVNKETMIGATQVIGMHGYRVLELAEHSSIVGT